VPAEAKENAEFLPPRLLDDSLKVGRNNLRVIDRTDLERDSRQHKLAAFTLLYEGKVVYHLIFTDQFAKSFDPFGAETRHLADTSLEGLFSVSLRYLEVHSCNKGTFI
jgi:hypothetical protein